MGQNVPQQGPLTTGQIAQFCHVTHRAVLKWVASGKLKSYRTPGKHSRVEIADFIAFLNEYHMPIPQEFQAKPILKKILIVDDDPGIVHALTRIFMVDNRFDVASAQDGFQAGQQFALHQPDLVILDIMMPGMDGYQVCREIRQKHDANQVKILCVSGISEPTDIKQIIDLGANDYLQKPFNNDELIKKVNQLLC